MQVERSEVGRKPYLDGLRGVAACMVFFDHLTLTLFPSVITFDSRSIHYDVEARIGALPIGWLWNGNFAVCIFFVLSGYVLSEFCTRTRIGLIAQIARRYVRLALPMLFTSAFALVIMALGLYKNLDAGMLVTKSDWLMMWYRAFEPSLFGMIRESLLDAFIQGSANYNSNLWTMRIELVGSIAVFLIFAIFRAPTRRAGAAAVFILLASQSYYGMFGVGMLFYALESRCRQWATRLVPSPRIVQAAALVVFLLGVYLGSFPDVSSNVQLFWYAFLPRGISALGWHMIGASLMVGGLLFSTCAQGWLGGWLGRYLGRLSFVLYLVHLPILCSLTSWIVFALSGGSYAIAALVAATVTIAAVFGVSTLFYRFIDIHSTSVSRQVGQIVDSWAMCGVRRLRSGPSSSKVPAQ